VNLRSALDLDASSELVGVPDEVLLALIERRLHRYLLRRLRSKLLLAVIVGLVILAIASDGAVKSPNTRRPSTPALAPISGPTAAAAPDSTAPATASDAAQPAPLAPASGGSNSVQSASSTGLSSRSETGGSSVGVTPQPPTRVRQAASLVIVESGYSSATGGTPLEQDPGNGALPIESAAGQHLKRSFIRLSGTAQIPVSYTHLTLPTICSV